MISVVRTSLARKAYTIPTTALFPTLQSTAQGSDRLGQLNRHFTTTPNLKTPMASSSQPIVVVAGVGPGTGASVARRFAKNYPVVVLARNPSNYEPLVAEIAKSGGKATGISTDIRSEESVAAAFDQIKSMGQNGQPAQLAAAIFNVGGSFIRKPFLELSLSEFSSGWESNGRGGFLFAHHALPLLLAHVSEPSPDRFPPTLIFTGATASVKGSAMFSSFATGKFALRALAQSLGREMGPRGVHVAHVVVDGVIDIERTKGWKVSDEPDAKISPEAIAEQYWYLHTQPRTMFTHELDIRPYVEKW